MPVNKLGLQVIGDRFDPARLVGPHGEKPAVVKLVDCSVAYYWKVRAMVGPMVLIIIRWVRREQPLDNPVQNARDWFEPHRAFILETMSDYTLFEGDNEQADSDATRYCAKELERIHLVHSVGAWAAIGNWSVGVPDLPVWAVYRPLVDACTGQDAMALHEYCTSVADIDNRWHCGRWTLVPVLAAKRIVITEFNYDRVEDQGQQGGIPLEGLLKYGALLERYPNVLGVTVFQTGSIDPQWAPFEVSGLWGQVTSRYEQEVTPVAKAFPIDGRQMNPVDFLTHCEGLSLEGKYTKVCIHHTAAPDEATWDKWGGWSYWGKRMMEIYANTNGWDRGPHLFVDQVGIGLFTPLTETGRAIGGGSAEAYTRHIEIVGNFMERLPSGARVDNAVAAAAILLKAGGLGIEALTYHRAMVSGASECPGALFIYNWPWFRGMVADKLAELMPHEGLPEDETATDPVTLAEKQRWWSEQLMREIEAKNYERAGRICKSLIILNYRLENALKAA